MLTRHFSCAFFSCLVLALTPGLLEGQADAPATTGTEWAMGLGNGPYEEMSTLLEVTIFNIDVLVLTVRVDSAVGNRLEEMSAGRQYSDELADSVAQAILGAERLAAHQRFVRNVSFGRLIGGMRESSEKAAEAGFVSEAHHDRFVASLPDLFAALEERGAREGDEIFFEISGDTVSTSYRTVEGTVLVDERGVDAEGRAGSIPSFFAPGSRFRQGLVRSLLESRPPG